MPNTRRWSFILGTSVPVALGLAALAAWSADQRAALTFMVFLAVLSPVVVGGAWVLVPDPNRAEGPEHHEETVEHAWLHRAMAGAFTDLLAVMGLALAAEHLVDAPALPLVLLIAGAMLDSAVRYAVLSRREG